VNNESSTDLAGELIEEKIPKATPVFLTYVILKRPSITGIDSFNSNWEWISDFVQRSRITVNATRKTYGSRACNFEAAIFGKL
jgi:hypothetical protein